MEETRSGTEEKKEFYEYTKFPKNVRQIGVPLPGTKIYLEDYVITYLKQCFVHAVESKIVLLLGKPGEAQAQDGIFLYGAIALEEEHILEKGEISKDTWDQVYETVHRDFSGAQILGWACGVTVWNSEVDSWVRRLQKAEFGKEDQTLFLWDLSEKEEKIFLWQKKMLKELSGYYVYFEKNPQMQEFMLDRQEPESIDADYEDTVTSSMRHVMEEKEEHRQSLQLLTYCGAVAAGIAILFGIHMMLESTARIQKMEQTVDTLSEYVGQQQEDVETMSRQAENAVDQIAFENQETEEPKQDKQTAEESAAATEQTAKNKETTAVVQSEAPGKQEAKASAADDASGEPASTETEENDTSGETSSEAETADASGETASEAEQASVSAKQRAQSYIVRKGDTLSQIVWRQYHDLSYEKKVKKVNGLNNADEIYEGQCLLLPEYKK